MSKNSIPYGVDPLFPKKRVVGYDLLGSPVFDMANTGIVITSFVAPEYYMGDMISTYKHGRSWNYYAAFIEYENRLIADRAAIGGI